MRMTQLIGSIFILLGAVFHFSAGLGMLRMPDAYTRMQAGTKASTLGNTLVLVGIAFYNPDWSLKLLILIFFVLVTNPLSSHALARAAHIIRTPMTRETRVDALRDAQQHLHGGS
jgi:multicomponent Na+:H+ antiporter subunit G